MLVNGAAGGVGTYAVQIAAATSSASGSNRYDAFATRRESERYTRLRHHPYPVRYMYVNRSRAQPTATGPARPATPHAGSCR